jgi:predicted RNA binding protein YcfA (HicA-like mRNA interferase family)
MSIAGIPGECREAQSSVVSPAQASPTDVTNLLRGALLWLDRVYDGRMKSREIIRELKKAGWIEVRQSGSHKQFRHPDRKGTVTVPHPNSNMAIGTIKSIERQSGVELR